MKRAIKIISCFFGKHEWKEESCSYDPDNGLTRTCIHCDKKQKASHYGEWTNL